MRVSNFLVSGPKIANFFAQCWRGCCWSPFRFLISQSLPEIFANKIWSSLKSCAQMVFGASTRVPITLLLVHHSSPNFLCLKSEGVKLIACFSVFHYVNFFRRYSYTGTHDQSQMLSEIVPNFRSFLPGALPNFKGGPSKSCTHIIAWIGFMGLIPLTPKVLGKHTMNFKPNFKCSVMFTLKILGVTTSPLGWALASLGLSLTRVKMERQQKKCSLWKKSTW